MNIYLTWKKFNNLGLSQDSFLKEFLNNNSIFEESYDELEPEEAKEIFLFLSGINVELFIPFLKKNDGIKSDDVVQFSSLKSAIIDTPNILDYSKSGLDYIALGNKLIDTANDGARQKYGENHGKLALMASLVNLTKEGTKNRFYLSKLGKTSTYFSEEIVLKVFKIMMLRNKLIQNIIFDAINAKCDYSSEVKFLSSKTIERRRSNVKQIVELILKDSQYEKYLVNIKW